MSTSVARPAATSRGPKAAIVPATPPSSGQAALVLRADGCTEPTLVNELGDEATKRLMFEAKGNLGLIDGVDYLAHSRRIFVVARKRDASPAC